MAGITRSSVTGAAATARALVASFGLLAAALVPTLFGSTVSAGEVSAYQGRGPTLAWAMSVGEIDADMDEVDGISVDDSGNVIISGIFRGRMAIGGKTMKSRGKGDIFLASISPTGRTNWSMQIGGRGDDNTFDLTTDKAGNIYASGWYTGSVDFGGKSVTSRGGTDQFVAKYTSAGKLVWVKSLGGRDNDGGNEISVLDNGEIAVSAISDGSFQAGGQTFRHGGGKRDAFVVRMSADGEVRWVTPFNGPGTERIRALAMAPSGDVYLGFQYRGSISAQGQKVTARGGWDGAAARLNSSGKLMWLKPVGSKGEDNVRGIGVGPDGSVYASGIIGGAGILIDRKVPDLEGKGADYVVRLSRDGKPQVILSLAGPGKSTGPELQADRRGVLISAVRDGALTIRRGKKVIAQVPAPGKQPTSYVIAFDADGDLRFIYSPTPSSKRSGALGDVLSVSRNGLYLAQALRYRGSLRAGGASFSTPSKKDSALVFLRMNGS